MGDGGKRTHAYELRDGKLGPNESEGPFVATITMSVKIFEDLIDAVLLGKAALGAERKFKARHIAYGGELWIVDSEQLRKVFRRMGSATGAGR